MIGWLQGVLLLLAVLFAIVAIAGGKLFGLAPIEELGVAVLLVAVAGLAGFVDLPAVRRE